MNDDNVTWIKDDPEGDPSQYRFEVGSLVLYKRETEESQGWFQAEVLKVCQILDIPPEFKLNSSTPPKKIAYIVWPHMENVDGTDWVDFDTDDYIRPRPIDQTPDPNKFHPRLAEPHDPLAHLYTGTKADPVDEEGNAFSKIFEKHDMVESARTNAGGTTTIKLKGGRSITTGVFQLPEEPVLGVHPMSAVFMGSSADRRRQYTRPVSMDSISSFMTMMDFEEKTLEELEISSRQSHKKMLQLGDALMAGVHGWPKDHIRACRCYSAAAWGCSEEEEPTRVGVLVGLPEAMVQYAMICKGYIQVNLIGKSLDENVPTSEILQYALRDPMAMLSVAQMFFFAATSIRRGWVSPFALDLAMAVAESSQLRMAGYGQIDKCDVDTLLQLQNYRSVEREFEKLQEKGNVPRGDPSNATIELFNQKVEEIYKSLAVAEDTIHIEFREFPRPPFPMVVFVIRPRRREVKKRFMKAILLSDNLQVSPFTLESFRNVWLRIVFELHLGVNGEGRSRPIEFTTCDSHGNRQFASYLKHVLSHTETNVRLVSHREQIKQPGGRNRKKRNATVFLKEIVSEIEKYVLELPGFFINSSTEDIDVVSGAQEEIVRHNAMELFDEVGNDKAKMQETAEHLKCQGNQLFTRKDYIAAIRCYSISIQLLGRVVDPGQDEYKLLGTLLSNRAASYLELEEQRTNTDFRAFLARKAMSDCSLALKSSWASRVLPKNITEKLKFRLDKASARYDVLQSEFESDIPSILFPERSNESNRGRDDSHNAANLESVVSMENEEAATDGALGTSTSEESKARPAVQATASSDIVFSPLLGRGQSFVENSLVKNARDGCPICLREFNGELSHSLSALLPCGQHALCVECVCQIKKESDKSRAKELACPLCRSSIDPQFVENLAFEILDSDQMLKSLITRFPADDQDSKDVACQLLWKQDFRVELVIDVLEEMLDARTKDIFLRFEDNLSHEKKDRIYMEARLPVEKLKTRLDLLLEERRTTFETARLVAIDNDIRSIRSDLATARKHARDKIYEKLNSVGNMGAELMCNGGSSGELRPAVLVDYHGLHVGEMKAKFQEHVMPILPVVKRVTVITGRGLHSASGESKLKTELKKYIERANNIRWAAVPDNPGALYVLWQGN